jgi:hypothetical protein
MSAMSPPVRLAGVLTALAVAACAGPPATAGTREAASTAAVVTPSATATSGASTPTVPAPEADDAGIVWLCRPGKADNPCDVDLSTTVIDRSGARTIETPSRATDPPVDCFYVYPTASRQPTVNADLSIDPEERAAAVAQAALFSQVCRVYAPIYPQVTIAGASGRVELAAVQTAYAGVKAAFDDYLANDNVGRGIVFLGHSQGAMHLIPLLSLEVDIKPELRRLLVSALLIGGNATTAPDSTTGGDFLMIPTCGAIDETGCVVGYSTFDETPPPDAAFGRTSSLGMLRPPHSREQVMCVNPAAPGGKGTLAPIFPTLELARLPDHPDPLPTTTYVAYPDELSAECRTSDDATWLQVTRIGPKGATPVLAGSEGPAWGLHELDVSLTLGNLVDLVRAQAAAYTT